MFFVSVLKNLFTEITKKKESCPFISIQIVLVYLIWAAETYGKSTRGRYACTVKIFFVLFLIIKINNRFPIQKKKRFCIICIISVLSWSFSSVFVSTVFALSNVFHDFGLINFSCKYWAWISMTHKNNTHFFSWMALTLILSTLMPKSEPYRPKNPTACPHLVM